MEMIAGRGSDLRGLYAGFSAKGAVLAAMMAQRGVTGIENMIEGRYGFMNTYFGGVYDRKAITRNLGTEFLGSGTLYKRWPCVGTAHSHMKAAIDIVTENDLNPDDIAVISLHVGDYHDLMCQPLGERRAPATLADAKFSLPFLVSVAIVRRGMSVTDFSAAGIGDPQVMDVGRRSNCSAIPRWIGNWNSHPGGSKSPRETDGRGCAKAPAYLATRTIR